MKKILKFYSNTCGPCKVMSKNLKELHDVEIEEIDALDENNEDLVEKWNIRTIPTIIVLENDKVISEFKGIVPTEKIQEVIDGK